MGSECKNLDDILAAGHPDSALVGVTIGMLRQWRALLPSAGSTPTVPIIGALAAGAAA